MQTYLGVKLIQATPMRRGDYNVYRGWELPADENGDDDGFLVEYLDGGQANHPAHKGYISWSPKGVFEQAYRPVTGLSFGLAIEALKNGRRVARNGWNGKGMFLYYVPASMRFPGHRSYIEMKTVDDEYVPWVASQTDIIAEDWVVL